jgi:hypothetical protein
VWLREAFVLALAFVPGVRGDQAVNTLTNPACATCDGRGEIGGFDFGENAYRSEKCPDCASRVSENDPAYLAVIRCLDGYILECAPHVARTIVAAIAALSPPATPQVPEDVRARAVAAIDEARTYAFGFPSSESVVGALDRAHLLATPVTVTMEDCINLSSAFLSLVNARNLHDSLQTRMAEALRRVLGDRIRISTPPAGEAS